MLVYLSVRREARRDELVDLLWGEVNEANARNAFRQALHRLRGALGEQLIPLERDRVGLAEADAIQSDRDAFLKALDRGDVATAIDLYRGDFLEGFELGEPVFDGWVDAERTRLQGRFQAALQSGAEAALGAGRWLEALQYVQRLTGVAPYDENAALLEANVLIAAGRTSEALMALRRFSHALREQLDLPPSPRIREMLARIERSEPARESGPSVASKPKQSTAFVGRELELGRLMSLVRDLSAERGATLLIEGPSGIGKTRLVTEFLSRAKALGPLLVLRGRERPLGTTLPYASLAEALRGALKAPGIAGTGRHLLGEAARILPELRDNFELPEAAPIEAEGGRLRFFEGIAAFLDSAAYEQPVCVVLDDMHNASPSTVELISYLTARLRSSPVLLLLLYRDEPENGGSVARLRSLGEDDEADSKAAADSMTLRIGPLDEEDLTRLVDGIILSREVAGQLDTERVAAAADGNPLRAIELARRALNGELPSAVPSRLRDILWGRLQRASPSQRRVFFAAALIQRRCSLRLLASAAHLPELAGFEAAQELENAGLLTQENDGYVIAHDFTTAFVTEASGLAGRALLAGWAADALAAESGAPSAELAHLYSLAGQQSAAFGHARRAVYDAAALGAGPEVHRLLGLALALAPDPKSREQVEAMMVSFGAGKKLLGAPDSTRPAEDILREAGIDTSSLDDPSRDQRAGTDFGAAADGLRGVPVPEDDGPDRSALAEEPRSAYNRIFTPRLWALIGAGLIATTAAFAWRRALTAAEGPRTLQDSLLVVERGRERDTTVFVITGPLSLAAKSRLGVLRQSDLPEWVRALSLPWIRPSVSPRGGAIAIERMTETGTDVFLMIGGADDPIPVATGGGTDVVLGWSPDGQRLLVRRAKVLSDGSFDADLWTYRVVAGALAGQTPIDTSSSRLVEEAAWSPDGTRIAWVAQAGSTHQRDVFNSRADGAGIQNLTNSPGEDYHIAWSSDGHLLAFTSDRDGNPDLFAIEFDEQSRRLWRLTNTPHEEDFPSFSPDRRFVAFQSTQGGDAAVYVMPALGGVPTRVTPAGGQFSISGWLGRTRPTYVDRFRVLGQSTARIGDSLAISVFGVDQDGIGRLPDSVPVRLADDGSAELRPLASTPGIESGSSHSYVLRDLRAGVVRVIASIPGWREDTLIVDVGLTGRLGLTDDFQGGLSPARWLSLGMPRPSVSRDSEGRPALFPNGDLSWQSGILSREVLRLADTIDVSAVFSAPFTGRPVAAALLNLALVAVEPDDSIDVEAPQLSEYVAVAWDGETKRLTYRVGPESRSDPVAALDDRKTHAVRIVIDSRGVVTFFVDSRPRWTSSLTYLGTSTDRSARLWLGGSASADWGSIRDLKVTHR